MPKAMLEAMACQAPNVLSRLDSYREFVTHEETAYLVDISPAGTLRPKSLSRTSGGR
jgi:glycosyltransferase involved in cell wall biosynthesis